MGVLAIDFGFGNIKFKTSKSRGIFRISELDHKVSEVKTVDELISFYPSVINKLLSESTEVITTLSLGLPLQAWKDSQIVSALHDEVFYKIREVDEIYIYPQAASVGYLAGDSLVIDFGHNTVIACLIVNSKIMYDKTYFRKGSVEIANEINNLIQHELAKVGKTLSSVELDEVFLKGKVQIGFDIIDLSQQVKQIKQDYIKRTLSLVINDLKVTTAGIYTFDKVFLIGGLAKDIQLQSQKVMIEIPHEPIFSNVEAFYQLAVLKVCLGAGNVCKQ